MLSRDDLQRIAEVRFDDALLLLRSNRPSSAYYLAGYAIELALKACISKIFQSNAIPDKSFVNAIHTHKLAELMNMSGLLPALNVKMKADSVFAGNWGIVSQWNESSRYEIWDPVAAASLLQAINDQEHGVLPWLKIHW